MTAFPDQPLSTPARTGWLLAWLAFWALMLTVAIQEHLSRGSGGLWRPLLWEGTAFIAASVLLGAMWRHAERRDRLLAQPLRWFAAALAWLPLLAPAFVVAIYAMRHGVFALIGQTYVHPPWPQVFAYECTKFGLFYLLFVAIVFGIRTHAALAEQRLRTREAQLAQLTQQLEPHFLFNALNTIAETVHTAPARADAMLTKLAALLRAASDLTRRPQCTLADELRLADGYAAIMVERFGERVSLRLEVDDAARGCEVPTLSLQPLLENAFRHGVERSSEPTTIVVRARRHDGRLRVEVEQDRGGLAPHAEPGVGLDTLRRRLDALHGARAACGIEALQPAGARAWFELPCTR